MLQGLQGKRGVSLQTKFLVPTVLGAVVLLGIIIVSMLSLKARNIELMGLTTAEMTADQIVTFRKFYTDSIAPRAKKAGMRVDFDFEKQENTIPLPATLVKHLGTEISKQHPGAQARLYSRFPFPHRAATEKYDAFEQQALEAVEKNPKEPVYTIETVDGRLSIRYVQADVMGEQCVACHNAHPQGPRKDWKVGDVRGALEVTIPVDTVAAGLRASTVTTVGLSAACLAVLTGIIVVMSRRTMIKPLRNFAEVSERVAQGDLEARVVVRSTDEVGTMAAEFNALLDRQRDLLLASQTERDSIQASVHKLQQEVAVVATGDLTIEAEATLAETGPIAESFNSMIRQLRGVIGRVQEATLQVSASANEVQATTEHLAQGSTAQASQIMDSSAAIDEMAVSIQQVADNATVSATVAEQALANARQGAHAVQDTITAMERVRTQVQETAGRIQSLGERSREIGDAVQLIRDIADRTSVLALNASIEAALAGEAGQGFAVVAAEVERLADRAAEASRQIAGVVNIMQGEVREAVTAMEESTQEVGAGTEVAHQAGQALSEIETVSSRLSDLILSISLAAKQQARGSESLSLAMGEISEVTQQTAAGTKQAAVSIHSLATFADELRQSVSTFKLPTNGHGPMD